MRRNRAFAILFTVLAGMASASAQTAAWTAPPDPFLWLENVQGARALAWVKAEDGKTLAVLQADPNFASLYADAVKIAAAKDRIPAPMSIQSQVYNFWQDEDHV